MQSINAIIPIWSQAFYREKKSQEHKLCFSPSSPLSIHSFIHTFLNLNQCDLNHEKYKFAIVYPFKYTVEVDIDWV